jgi:hypothetical protein
VGAGAGTYIQHIFAASSASAKQTSRDARCRQTEEQNARGAPTTTAAATAAAYIGIPTSFAQLADLADDDAEADADPKARFWWEQERERER